MFIILFGLFLFVLLVVSSQLPLEIQYHSIYIYFMAGLKLDAKMCINLFTAEHTERAINKYIQLVPAMHTCLCYCSLA